MYSPSLSEFTVLLASSGLVPLVRTLVADLDTPLTIFAKVARDESHAFLFESVEGGEKWGRYSFIGIDPLVNCASHGERVTSESVIPGWPTGERQGNPLAILREMLASCRAAFFPGMPRFIGGAVGFLGYDMVRFIERIPDRHAPFSLPDSAFIVPRLVLIHDSLQQTLTMVCNVVSQAGDDPARLYEEARARIEAVIARVQGPVPPELHRSTTGCPQHDFRANMDQAAFAAMVERAKEYILAGDIIQVVLSQRFHAETGLDSLTLYRALRHINPSPYLFLLRFGEMSLIGSSPEILVRKEGPNLELRPIAGTRRRGVDSAEDLALERELLQDPKERAEHLMLVDLGRNDLGRVARGGSVSVGDLLVIERYSHVMHIVSGVHAELAPDKDQFDVLAACFPAGTVSGAPKIRAMEIIDELEVARRGPYAGAVGYFGFSGNMDFCITIRTMVQQGRDLWIQAGAGIVADSVPEREYEETVNKAKALRRAVELAEQGF
jgi:anthranilate synthase component 1